MSLQTQINADGLPSVVPTAYTPVAATTIPVTTEQIHLTNAGAVSMTATPAIATSGISAGTRLTLLQTAAGGTTLTSGGSSGLKLASASRTIAQYQTLALVFDGTYWCEESFSASGGGGGGGSGIIPFDAGIDDGSVFLLPGTGASGSTTFTTTSFGSFPLTPAGNTQISTAVRAAGAIYFDGTGDYITSLPSPAWSFGAFDFTVEMWIYPTGFITINPCLLDTQDSANNPGGFVFLLENDGSLVARRAGSVQAKSAAGTITLNAWQHVAAVWYQGTITLYINGVSVATSNWSTANFTNGNLTIGTVIDLRDAGSALHYMGHMNDLRISKFARYTSAFTPPAFPLSAGYNSALLPASPAAGQMAMSTYNLYACTNATGPAWKRTALSST